MFLRFDVRHVSPTNNFEYKNTLSCQVAHSTYKDLGEPMMEYYIERNIQLTSLDTDTPQLSVAGFEQPLKKIQDGTYTATFYTESVFSEDMEDSSIEMIQVHKLDGTFVRTFVGTGQYFGSREILHPEGFHLVIAQKGRCE
ncbi:MAG: hypothetical protein Q8P56_06590 [Candidatus Uhrbacteria bacterium]|nr:hypothetical protein [Candidatus Uhrbacteria bacterium]